MKFQPSTVLVLFGALSGLVAAAPANNLETRQCECTPSITDELVFESSMSTFQAARDAEDPSCCDWSSDNCSKSPDNPRGYQFTPSCQRHDFGYRNSKDQDRFTEAQREKIDDQFKDDLYGECSQYDGIESWKGVECRGYAEIYYAAVRACGDGNCLD